MSCLDNIIKLSRTECECFENNSQNLDINEGQSEIYLDELEGLQLAALKASEGCESGELWDFMAKARTNATLQFKADLLAAFNTTFIPKRSNYSGLMGQSSFTSTLNISQSYAGNKIVTKNIVGGYMTINRIGLIMNAVDAIQVRVYDNDENQTSPLASYTINSAANAAAYATIAGGLKLPMWSKNGVDLEYYFVYTKASFQPKNNKVDCGCGGKVSAVSFKQWVSVYGIKGNTTEYSAFQAGNELNGLILDAEFKCDASRLICSDEFPLDFENDGRALQMAYAVRFKSGALLIDYILSSPEINRYTMMDREALYGKRNYYRKSYEDLIVFLSDSVEVKNNDCLMCKDSNQFTKGRIIV